jgi:hypothetical protein
VIQRDRVSVLEGVPTIEGTGEMNTLIVGRAITGLGAFV